MPHSRMDPGHGSGSPKYPGTFLLALREAAGGLGWQVRRCTGHLAVCVDAAGREHVIGLENLYRRARRAGGREGWPALIAEFLRTVAEVERTTELPAELDAVADRLLIRLGHCHGLAGGDKVWSRPLPGTDLAINLVIDYPDRLCYVTESLMSGAGATADARVERALDNLLARTPPDCLPVVHEETGLRLCAVGDSYDSSRALLLDKLLPGEGPDGFFVSLPARDQLLVLTVNRDALANVHLMKLFAQKSYRGLPYPISEEVYWVRGGAWHRFGMDVRSERVVVTPPQEFVEVLKRLMPEDESDEPDTPTA